MTITISLNNDTINSLLKNLSKEMSSANLLTKDSSIKCMGNSTKLFLLKNIKNVVGKKRERILTNIIIIKMTMPVIAPIIAYQ